MTLYAVFLFYFFTYMQFFTPQNFSPFGRYFPLKKTDSTSEILLKITEIGRAQRENFMEFLCFHTKIVFLEWKLSQKIAYLC